MLNLIVHADTHVKFIYVIQTYKLQLNCLDEGFILLKERSYSCNIMCNVQYYGAKNI